MLHGKTLATLLLAVLMAAVVPARTQCVAPTNPLLVSSADQARLDRLLPSTWVEAGDRPEPSASRFASTAQTYSNCKKGGADQDTFLFERTAEVFFPQSLAESIPPEPDAPSSRTTNSADPDARRIQQWELPLLEVAPPPAELDTKVKWRKLMEGSFRYLAVMHAFRLATEPATRYAFLNNPFWSGYGEALGAMHGWSDGDSYYENYLGHPIQGAVSAFIWIHNDPRYRNVEFGKNPDYWKSRLRAYLFAFAFSEQFEVGLLSEASIGQIQRYCCQFGFVDHVITPNGGIVWVVAEDMVDKYVIRRIEDRTQNLGVRIAARVALSPLLSFANFMNAEYPWYRENRAAPSRYEGASSYLNSVQTQKPSPKTYSLVPEFEFTATLPSVMSVDGLSCLGGGGIGGFHVAQQWQWTLEVSGCTLGNSLPADWSGDSLTFTTGPEWIRHTESRWSPHAHIRFGGQKITLQHTDPKKRALIEKRLPPGTNLNPYYNLFNTSYESTGVSLSMGGGVDYRLYSGLALRVANLDYMRSWLNPVNGRDFNTGVRFTAGVVLRIGTW